MILYMSGLNIMVSVKTSEVDSNPDLSKCIGRANANHKAGNGGKFFLGGGRWLK